MPAENPLEPRLVFARDVREGLRHYPKQLHAKHFYDAKGSELFEQITRQPEYYPTRTEAAILREHARVIRDSFGGGLSLVELGSGSSSKTKILLESLLAEQDELHYLPIDISPRMLRDTAQQLESQFDGLSAIPIASEYRTGLSRANQIISEHGHLPDRKLVLFLGSSIGNLEPDDALAFLCIIRARMQEGDGFLVGFDLQKDREVLHAAYNDRAGVTARFNLNMLARINRELGGEFDLEQFSHRAFYNESEGRIEMHLVSAKEQSVFIHDLGEAFPFQEQETIHTESSYKYTLKLIDERTRAAGFAVRETFTDERKWFALVLLVPI